MHEVGSSVSSGICHTLQYNELPGQPVHTAKMMHACCCCCPQASQQDDDEARDNTLGSPEFHPRSALFSSPLGDTPEAAAADGVGASAQPAAAAAGAATGYDSRRGC
jgi:hypothetical protein